MLAVVDRSCLRARYPAQLSSVGPFGLSRASAHHRQGVHHTLIQLCSGMFGHGHGVDGGLQLRMKQGVETLLSSRSSRGWFAVETSTFLWSCIRAGTIEELMYANEEWDFWQRLMDEE